MSKSSTNFNGTKEQENQLINLFLGRKQNNINNIELE